MVKKYQDPGQYIDLGFFVWPISKEGYYIAQEAKTDVFYKMRIMVNSQGKDLGEEKGPFVIEKAETTEYLISKPLEESPSLFLDFAELDGLEENMLRFANQYGLLFREITLESAPQTKSVFGDRLSLWQREHRELKNAVELWKWIKKKNTEKLNLVITWHDNNKTIKYVFGSEDKIKAYRKEGITKDGLFGLELGILASAEEPELNTHLLSRIVPGDVIIPAQIVLQRIMNKKLQQYPVWPKLLLDKDKNLRQYLYPENLLSAMWFQFFQAVSGEKKYKKCEVCNKWEDVTDKRSSWAMHPNCAARERMRRRREKEE